MFFIFSQENKFLIKKYIFTQPLLIPLNNNKKRMSVVFGPKLKLNVKKITFFAEDFSTYFHVNKEKIKRERSSTYST